MTSTEDCLTLTRNEDCLTLTRNEDCLTLTRNEDCVTLTRNADCLTLTALCANVDALGSFSGRHRHASEVAFTIPPLPFCSSYRLNPHYPFFFFSFFTLSNWDFFPYEIRAAFSLKKASC